MNKQIEELANVMCDDCRAKTPSCERIICDSVVEAATAIYNAGYRKQREGEWVWKKKIEPQAQNRLYCSNCDEECPSKNNYYTRTILVLNIAPTAERR